MYLCRAVLVQLTGVKLRTVQLHGSTIWWRQHFPATPVCSQSGPVEAGTGLKAANTGLLPVLSRSQVTSRPKRSNCHGSQPTVALSRQRWNSPARQEDALEEDRESSGVALQKSSTQWCTPAASRHAAHLLTILRGALPLEKNKWQKKPG